MRDAHNCALKLVRSLLGQGHPAGEPFPVTKAFVTAASQKVTGDFRCFLAFVLSRFRLHVFLHLAMLSNVERLPAERRMLAGKPEKDRESFHVL